MGLIITDEKFCPMVKGILETAEKSILISTFKAEISKQHKADKLTELFEIIAEKARTGVQVRLLINWHDDRKSVPKTNQYVIHWCKQNNIKIRHLKFNRCCHAKIIIVDKEKAIIGSHNLSVRSMNNNFEISYLLANQEDIRPLLNIYDKTWSDALKA